LLQRQVAPVDVVHWLFGAVHTALLTQVAFCPPVLGELAPPVLPAFPPVAVEAGDPPPLPVELTMLSVSLAEQPPAPPSIRIAEPKIHNCHSGVRMVPPRIAL
jgi:hypothetical protein